MWILIALILFFLIRNHIEKNKYEDSLYKEATGKNFNDVVNNKGDNGERLTLDILEELPGFGRAVVNVYIPTENGTTEVDLIYIHRTGIYVIESKNYSGTITGSEDDYKWVQHLENGKKFEFYNPIKQNEGHMRALKNLLSDVDENMFTSIVVFSKRCTLKVKSTSVKVINRDDLFSVMNRQIKEETRRIPIDKIEEIYMKLKKYSNLDDAAKVEHIKNIKRNYRK